MGISHECCTCTYNSLIPMSRLLSWAAFSLLSLTAAQNITQTTSFSFSPTPVSTSVPSPTAPLNSTVPGQGIYPPIQALCAGGANVPFCPGVLLQDVQLSGIFSDSKTFVDKPTAKTLNETLSAWEALGDNVTVGQVETFVEQYFKGEGLELSQIQLENFVEDPAILDNIADPVFRAWVKVVNGYWTLLARETNQSALCNGDCESSLIPLNHTIIVPGGRYREIYYWDSFWVLEGLLKSELYDYAWDLLQNFMDIVDVYGYLPNGQRKYYLNRSQPPVFVQMIDAYIKTTNNITLLERALPVASAELEWWANNRTANFTSPFTNKSRIIARYSVTNSAPRPEGYVEDFETVMGASPALNETEQAELYSELATGAESGWDYSSRWCEQPLLNTTDNNPALRTLKIKSIIPVDLLSLMAGDHALLANMYELYANSTGGGESSGNQKKAKRNGGSGDDSASKIAYHRQMAQEFSDSILDLCWDPEKSWFYDFNMTSNSRSNIFHPGGAWPLWQNITPSEIAGNESAALSFVSGFRFLLGHYSGVPSVATLLFTGLNWDFPNAWPPHAYTSIKAFETLGRMLPNAAVLSNLTIPFDSVTQNQLGLSESELQPQPQSTIGNVSLNTETSQDKPWPLALSIEFANRYLGAAFCSWYSTGGEISGLLTQLPLSDLNATGTYTSEQSGVMFEKFNVTDTDAAGGGGEYTVQVGFGWTNGVALWAAGEYGQYIPAPTCPLIPIIEVNATSSSNSSDSSVYNSTDEDRGPTASDNTTSTSLFVGYRIPRE
ncbi:alpha,alpha-trehalase [Cryptococcus neoformans c8]|nr:alpha,alpha-trehalase [Cryptococcus neoformans var. grubii AD1-83a]OXG57875.1 alpha,alpha-trehalase [Cryptococcus neoformans var. grubii CHC193]OXG61128.1 alpha,alpha-trehalase [Cryptococcus neoformans var. grubii c8]OXH06723.1 alpha,alpha-trehalase [Cryptococcus neoformans var. grubii A5-35-17]OXH07950.1 alpha,alpha-trehalase [Cryptococcus neoformans var. grubii A1-35-8]